MAETASSADMAKRTAEFFSQAGDDEDLSERLGFAQTILHIHFDSDRNGGSSNDDASCTVWLDRIPVEAEVGLHDDAEIELWASSDNFLSLILGDEAMAMSIVHGNVTYKGPVRKFLRVVPLLRTFDFDAFKGVKPDDHSGEGHYARDLEVDAATEDEENSTSARGDSAPEDEEEAGTRVGSESPDTGRGLDGED